MQTIETNTTDSDWINCHGEFRCGGKATLRILDLLMGDEIEVIREESIFICGPWTHNHVPGKYIVAEKRFSWRKSAERHARRGWIPRLRKLAESRGWIVRLYPKTGVYPKGGVEVSDGTQWGTATAVLEFDDLPFAGEHTLPSAWRQPKH